MKKTFLLFVLIIATLGVYAANDVIKFTWKGSTERKQFIITATEGEPFTVDWGDGSEPQTYVIYYSDEFIEQSVAYGDENEYTVTVTAAGDCFITSFSIAGTWSDWEEGRGATSVDLSNANSLQYFYCQYNQLTELEVSNLTQLKRVDCHYNNLTEVDVAALSNLTYLTCHTNQLTELDITNNTQLFSLSCHSNQLTGLNTSGNPQLSTLYCQSNLLTALDLANNPQLTDLYCQHNELTDLNIADNPLIEYMDCSWNHLPLSCLYAVVEGRTSIDNLFLTPQYLGEQAALANESFSLAREMNLGGLQTKFFVTKDGLTATEDVDYTLDYDNETITFLGEGNFHALLSNLSVSSNEWSGVEIPFSVTEGSNIDSISAGTITIYPNPATDNFRINGITTPTAFTLSDMTGKIVVKGTVAEGEGVAIGHLSAGIYILRSGNAVSKLIIKD